MYLSMNFLTVPGCTWLHTQSVPDHTWCELSHWQLLALCMDPLPCMRHLSLPDYLHPTVRVHMATHWTSFPVDIVLMTPGVHWVQATTARQDLLCKDYGWWVIIPARTPLPGHHNTARTTQYQYFVHQYYVLLCMMIVERDRKPDYRSPHLSAHETQHSKKYCIGQSAVQNIVQKTAQNAVKYA